jgi:hypothetical protein
VQTISAPSFEQSKRRRQPESQSQEGRLPEAPRNFGCRWDTTPRTGAAQLTAMAMVRTKIPTCTMTVQKVRRHATVKNGRCQITEAARLKTNAKVAKRKPGRHKKSKLHVK